MVEKKIDSGPYQHGKSISPISDCMGEGSAFFLLHILGARLQKSVLCMVSNLFKARGIKLFSCTHTVVALHLQIMMQV